VCDLDPSVRFFLKISPALPDSIAIFVLALALCFLMPIGERRRAIIFAAGTVTYRPLFGVPHVVAFRKILGLRRTVVSYGRSPMRAIALDLPDSYVEAWPLVFFDAQTEILDRLSVAAGKPVTGEWSRWIRWIRPFD
jgi:hypothetical protein